MTPCRLKSAAWAALALLAASAASAAEDWPQLKFDARHSGNAPGRSVETPLGLIGAMPLGDAIFTAPVVAGGRNASSRAEEWSDRVGPRNGASPGSGASGSKSLGNCAPVARPKPACAGSSNGRRAGGGGASGSIAKGSANGLAPRAGAPNPAPIPPMPACGMASSVTRTSIS